MSFSHANNLVFKAVVNAEAKMKELSGFLPLERVLSVLKVDLFVLLLITSDKADLLTKLLFCFFFFCFCFFVFLFFPFAGALSVHKV